MAFISATPILSTRPSTSTLCSSRPALSFLGAPVARVARVAPHRPVTSAPRMEFEISDGVPFKVDITTLALAIVGWVVPSSIPANIPLTEGTGLSQAFFASMNANLAAFPKGPSADDPFWTLLFLWHVGLFACMIFGTIGANLNNPDTA